MPNRLAASRSPYLLQHAHQPVDWQEWGPAAFEQARKENKPIFLSAGYSTCHWCHVMARESFDDPSVADVLNTLFVNVKLDREERPDVDRLYMAFVQATTGHGGWPMSVWLTPDLKPFYGGTYFPPRPGHGRPSFLDVVRALASAWAGDRERLVRNAGEIADALAQAVVGGSALSPAIEPPSHDEIVASIERFHGYFDEENGGFGGAPKFPRPALLLGLSRAAHRAGTGSPARRTAERMLTGTLHALCAGGIRDHLGGGFHRYSVDARWHVPHFEKMLYDQGQIATALADGILQLGLDDLRPALRELCTYVARDLTHPDGGCHAAEDADSAEPGSEGGHGHGREGAFYTWSAEEARSVLGPELYPFFEYAYGMSPHGNVPGQHDPHREMDGLNVLERVHGDAAVAQRFGIGEDRAVLLLGEARTRLLAARAARPRPHLDDKVLAGWNGLMLSGLSRAARALGETAPAGQAVRIAEFARTRLVDPASGRLHRTWRGSLSPVPAFAEDHAALALGLLDLYETTFDWKHLAWSLELQEQLLAGFEDSEHGGFFSTRAGSDDLLLRMKEDHDGAEPSASSLAALALARTSAMLELPRLRESAARTVRAFAHRWRVEPFSMPAMLAAADFLAGPVTQVVVSGDPGDPATRGLLETVQARFLPRSVVLLDDRGAGREWLARHLPALAAGPLAGPPSAHVCREGACSSPVREPEQLLELLADA